MNVRVDIARNAISNVIQFVRQLHAGLITYPVFLSRCLKKKPTATNKQKDEERVENTATACNSILYFAPYHSILFRLKCNFFLLSWQFHIFSSHTTKVWTQCIRYTHTIIANANSFDHHHNFAIVYVVVYVCYRNDAHFAKLIGLNGLFNRINGPIWVIYIGNL